MKYTITEILPAQIKVEFEDNSWAYIPISPEATPEEIDSIVANYDPTFLPDPQTLINTNISVGEIRESKKIEIDSFEPNTYIPPDPFTGLNIFLADYFAEKGDNRVKELMKQKLEEYLVSTQLTVDQIIDSLLYDPEDIIAQAESELNAE
jgi:hypothetical protein